MRIKIHSRKADKDFIMEANIVQPYCNMYGEECGKLCVDGIVFDIGDSDKVKELLDFALKNGYLDLTSYKHMVLDGMVSWKMKP